METQVQPSTFSILINVGIQVVNILLVLVIFVWAFGKPLVKELKERDSLIRKLKAADEVYYQKIQEAEIKAKDIIAQGMMEKEHIITEWEALALKKQVEIIDEANRKHEKIISDAQNTTKTLEEQLEKNFVASVKKTSNSVVKRLLQSDKKLQEDYLDKIVKDFL